MNAYHQKIIQEYMIPNGFYDSTKKEFEPKLEDTQNEIYSKNKNEPKHTPNFTSVWCVQPNS